MFWGQLPAAAADNWPFIYFLVTLVTVSLDLFCYNNIEIMKSPILLLCCTLEIGGMKYPIIHSQSRLLI